MLLEHSGSSVVGLMKKIKYKYKRKTTTRKDILCTWIGRVTIVKMSVLAKTTFLKGRVRERERENLPSVALLPKWPQMACGQELAASSWDHFSH